MLLSTFFLCNILGKRALGMVRGREGETEEKEVSSFTNNASHTHAAHMLDPLSISSAEAETAIEQELSEGDHSTLKLHLKEVRPILQSNLLIVSPGMFLQAFEQFVSLHVASDFTFGRTSNAVHVFYT